MSACWEALSNIAFPFARSLANGKRMGCLTTYSFCAFGIKMLTSSGAKLATLGQCTLAGLLHNSLGSTPPH